MWKREGTGAGVGEGMLSGECSRGEDTGKVWHSSVGTDAGEGKAASKASDAKAGQEKGMPHIKRRGRRAHNARLFR